MNYSDEFATCQGRPYRLVVADGTWPAVQCWEDSSKALPSDHSDIEASEWLDAWDAAWNAAGRRAP